MGSRFREIADREVAHPDVPDLARPVEGLESLHRLPQGDLAPRIRPMHLIKVDLPDSEALQTSGTRFLHVIRAQMPTTDFRRDEDAVPPYVPDCLAHDALRMAVAVSLRSVDQVDPKLHGALHRLAALGISDVGAPGLPSSLPHPQSDRGNVGSTAAQRHVLHPTAARPTHRGAKNLSRREIKPFGRMVRQAKTEERFVVLVVQSIGFRDSLPEGLLERGPVFRFNGRGDRSERLAD